MPYRYNYGALMGADATNNNFRPLSEVVGTADHTNMATALLEAKGLTAGTAAANAFLASANTAAGDSQVAGFQNLAGLSESDTAVARGDTWGGSDDTMGKSWLEKIVSGDLDSSNVTIEDLYQTGFGRASDVEGKEYWGHRLAGTGDYGAAISISKIAESFLASEESTVRSVYHDSYGRDADESGLTYWLNHTGTADYKGDGTDGGHHGDYNVTELLKKHVADSNTKETNVRNLLSAELGLHSTDAQRLADTTLHGADGIAGTADDIFTDASDIDVQRMTESADLGASEVADKVTMQKAAQSMGDYGGGVNDVGADGTSQATNIHRMLTNAEMGSVVEHESGQKDWVSDSSTLAKTADDYLPQVTTDDDGNVTTTNQWSLLEDNTQDYTQEDVEVITDPLIENNPSTENPNDEDNDDDDTDDGIQVSNEDVDYTPPIESDVKDTSTYTSSKTEFDHAAAGIDAPLQDMMIRNSQMMGVGGSAEGVRLKRSKKFKTGESALGTKQLGRQLQLKSLNI